MGGSVIARRQKVSVDGGSRAAAPTAAAAAPKRAAPSSSPKTRKQRMTRVTRRRLWSPADAHRRCFAALCGAIPRKSEKRATAAVRRARAAGDAASAAASESLTTGKMDAKPALPGECHGGGSQDGSARAWHAGKRWRRGDAYTAQARAPRAHVASCSASVERACDECTRPVVRAQSVAVVLLCVVIRTSSSSEPSPPVTLDSMRHTRYSRLGSAVGKSH